MSPSLVSSLRKTFSLSVALPPEMAAYPSQSTGSLGVSTPYHSTRRTLLSASDETDTQWARHAEMADLSSVAGTME